MPSDINKNSAIPLVIAFVFTLNVSLPVSAEPGHGPGFLRQNQPVAAARGREHVEGHGNTLSGKGQRQSPLSDRPNGQADFLYLGDTEWELFHRLNREEADLYLRDRAAKRFTVIQAVVLAEFDGLDVPTRMATYRWWIRTDPAGWSVFRKLVDFIVNRAEQLGLVLGMLPNLGDKWNKKWGRGRKSSRPKMRRICPANSWAVATGISRSFGFWAAIVRSRGAAKGYCQCDGGRAKKRRWPAPPGDVSSLRRPKLRRWLAKRTLPSRLSTCFSRAMATITAITSESPGLSSTAHKTVHGRRARLRRPPRGFQSQEWLPRRLRGTQVRLLVAVCGCPRPYVRLS